jgi:hypothetical protein
MTKKVFDPEQLSIVIGSSGINGFAEDSMLTIEMEDPTYTISYDISGEATRFKSKRSSATITLRLTQSSPSNDLLSGYLELDRVTNGGMFEMVIKDGSGTSLFSSLYVFVEQAPTVEFGAENKTREWTLKATSVSHFVGGVR